MDILVPQQAQVPIIARRLFFISVRVAASISCLARQRTQYPITLTSSNVPEINLVKIRGLGTRNYITAPALCQGKVQVNITPKFSVLGSDSFFLGDVE